LYDRVDGFEEIVKKISLSLVAAFFFTAALVAPDIATAAGAGTPNVPAQTTQPTPNKKAHAKKPKGTQKSGSLDDFLAGYHAAYALIYDQGDCVTGIAALRALGFDDNADVANLIGYASRKLGRYDDAKFWYERALAADPNHSLTWS
jgi:tetratricopeptide (TPR) repeat protein